MRTGVLVVTVAVLTLHATAVPSAPPPRPVVNVGVDRFDVSGEGNSVVGVRRAPVPYSSFQAIATALTKSDPLPAAVRLTRVTPPQVIDYVFCVTEDGALVVGQQVRTLDIGSQRYVAMEGEIKRVYRALEARVPWTWIVDIPLGREVDLSLELSAMTATWPVHAIAVTPRLR
jgi:hypothetical protein